MVGADFFRVDGPMIIRNNNIASAKHVVKNVVWTYFKYVWVFCEKMVHVVSESGIIHDREKRSLEEFS